MKGRINEIFSSIQGEGIYAGQRQVFVRFAECNLNCSYCDTEFGRYREYEPDELLSEIESFGREIHSISFTGGEPLLQKDFLKEISLLTKKADYRNYLETNGTLPLALQEVIDNFDIIAMDIKLPSSGSLNDFWQAHRDFLKIARRREVFIKAVICASTSDKDVMEMYSMLKEARYPGILVLQPNSFEMGGLNERLALLKKHGEDYSFRIYVIPQIHKLMGVR